MSENQTISLLVEEGCARRREGGGMNDRSKPKANMSMRNAYALRMRRRTKYCSKVNQNTKYRKMENNNENRIETPRVPSDLI